MRTSATPRAPAKRTRKKPVAKKSIAAKPATKPKKPLPIIDFNNTRTHWHRCWSDGYVWAHTPTGAMVGKAHDKAHACPKCGTPTYSQEEVSEFEMMAFLTLNKKKVQIVGDPNAGRRAGF
jgi:hypothetical protein